MPEQSRVQPSRCGRDEQTSLARRLREVRGLHTSWCEGVVNGALVRTRAWCETLGARYAELATKPCASTQSPESRIHTCARWVSVGMGPGPGPGMGL